MNTKDNNQKGVVALLIVIIVGASTLIMAISSALLGMGELDLGYTMGRSEETLVLTDGCVEEALLQIKRNTSYIGESLVLSNGSCIISVVSSGSDRIITVVGTVENYNKKIEVTLTLSGNQIIINSWKEKDD